MTNIEMNDKRRGTRGAWGDKITIDGRHGLLHKLRQHVINEFSLTTLPSRHVGDMSPTCRRLVGCRVGWALFADMPTADINN
jgi:hypothetical protein